MQAALIKLFMLGLPITQEELLCALDGISDSTDSQTPSLAKTLAALGILFPLEPPSPNNNENSRGGDTSDIKQQQKQQQQWISVVQLVPVELPKNKETPLESRCVYILTDFAQTTDRFGFDPVM